MKLINVITFSGLSLVALRGAPALATPSQPITFTEFPLNTFITDQYASEKGVIFEGDSPFITTDSANPTSPVLSGSPRFQGQVAGRFVNMETGEPSVVQSFYFDAGFFDEIGSTRLKVFDPDGNLLTQTINKQNGIERLAVDEGNIARFEIEIFRDEPAGYAIDNFASEPVSTSLIFREQNLISRVGRWPWQFQINAPIPGFDHVGLHVDDVVYEAHPGYTQGVYRGEDPATPTKTITEEDGVQMQFTRKLFLHNSQIEASPVDKIVEVPIPRPLAEAMKSKIEEQLAAEYLDPNFRDFSGTWSNTNQKGAGGKFTCVGLIEWAAEQAGHNNGQGFVPNILEEIDLSDAEGTTVLLSPELMRFCAVNPKACAAGAFVKGLFDPVDYVLTDPLGRRMGYTEATGPLDEIPGALRTANGLLEQILIPAAVPGVYSVSYTGVGADARGGFSIVSLTDSIADEVVQNFSGFLDVGEVFNAELTAPVLPGSRGDVNMDGVIDDADVVLFESESGRFTEGLYDRFDLDGNGVIDDEDEALLVELVAAQQATVAPTSAPTAMPTQGPDEEDQQCTVWQRILQFLFGWLRKLLYGSSYC